MALKKKDRLSLLLFAAAAAYVIGILLINYHSAAWYTYDMYADAYVARLMSQERSFFPKDWYFGNQYYIIATPVLASLIYSLIPDSVSAMALASSLMLGLILFLFIWCCRPLFSTRAIAAGTLSLVGATILGDSAANCVYGLQLFYTMASYYACYAWVLLFHLGIWLRLRRGLPVSALLPILAMLCDIALGLQSPRETLVLNLPLVLLAGLLVLRRKQTPEKRGLRFALAALAFNLLGLGAGRLIPAQRIPNIAPLQFNRSASDLLAAFRATASSFLELIGLRYLSQSWKWQILTLLALVLLLVSVWALIKALKTKPESDQALPLLLCWISLLCVFGVGVLLFRVRAIYFFVWYLLLPFSLAYLVDSGPAASARFLCCALLACGMINAVYTFYPDYHRYSSQMQFYREIVAYLQDQEITVLYGDYEAPSIAACSADTIRSSPIYPQADMADGALLAPFGSPVSAVEYRQVDPAHSLLVLSDSAYDEASGYRWLQSAASDAYREEFEKAFQLVKRFHSPNLSYYLYRFDDPAVLAEFR